MVYGPLIHLSPVIKYEQLLICNYLLVNCVSFTIIQLKRTFGFVWDWISKYLNGTRVNVDWLLRKVTM